MTSRPAVPTPGIALCAAALLYAGAAFAQNPTTAGELQIEPQVSSVGSILTTEENTPVVEESPAAPVSDREVLPAGNAIDAASTRRSDEQDLNVSTPRVPLGLTRPTPTERDDIDEEVPLGAGGNSYRPSSSTGFYDGAVEEDYRSRGDEIAPAVDPGPGPVDPIRPSVPPGDYNLPSDNSLPGEDPVPGVTPELRRKLTAPE